MDGCRWILFFLLCTIVGVRGYSQAYQLQVQHFTMEDGLPNRFVNQVMQDQEEFIWVSTLYGLCRFDGHDFKAFKTDISGLGNNNVFNTYQDDAGLIWIRYLAPISSGEKSRHLLDIINPHTFEIKSFDAYFKAKTRDLDGGIITINTDNSNNLWLLTDQASIYKYRSKEGFVKDTSLSKIISSLFDDWANQSYLVSFFPHKAHCWLFFHATDTTIYHVNLANEKTKIELPSNRKWIDAQGQLWLQDKSRLNQFHVTSDGRQFKTIVYPFDAKEVQTMHTDPNGNLWVRLKNAIHIYDKQQRLMAKLDKNNWSKNYDPISFDRVFFDRQNNAWIPSPIGLYKISLLKNAFTNYLGNGWITDTRAIVVDKDGIIYANQWQLYRIGTKSEVLDTHQLVSLIKDGDFLYAGMYDTQVLQYNLKNGQQRLIYPASPKNFMSSMIPYKSKKTGTMWLGGISGLAYVDTNKFVYLPFTAYHGFNELSKSTIYFFYENKEGIWLATSDGIYLLDEEKGIVAHYKEQFPYTNICHIYEDKKGIFWLATRGGGLLRWDRSANQVQQFTEKEGLSHEVVYAVYEDDFGYLWIPSNYGLMRFQKTSLHVVNTFLVADGIPHEEFNTYSHFKAPDGRFFFGGLGGITSFHPKDFLDTMIYKAPLRITGFKKLNRKSGEFEDYTAEALTNNILVVNPNENSFLLSFSLLDYLHATKNQYAYKIDGLDQKWTSLKSNVLQLGRLPYGRYNIHIKERRTLKAGSEVEINIPLWIKTPLYLQGWFIALGVLMVSALVIGVVRWRLAQLKKVEQRLQVEVSRQTIQIHQQAEKLQALDEQKSRFFLDVAHELRTPLTLISSPIELFLQKEPLETKTSAFLQSIRKNTQHLLRLVESILDLGRMDANQLELKEETVHLYTLVQQVFEMYKPYAAMHNIPYQLHYEADQQLQLLLDDSKFEKILHNLLSNAVKFTSSAGKVKLEVKEELDNIIIQVIDTGKGIAPDELPHIFERYFRSKSHNLAYGGMGIGLHIAREYAHTMQGTLTVESILHAGSTFSFSFPKKAVAGAAVMEDVDKNNSEQELQISNTTTSNGKRHKLLVVEDSNIMQGLFKQILESKYQVFQAPNGKIALNILKNQRIEGIITDIMMPQMNGFELVETIKSNEEWRQIPIIIITARANEVEKLQMLRMGVDDYLYKPFSPQELQIKINNLLINHQNRVKFPLKNEEDTTILSADHQWLLTVETRTLTLLQKNPGFKLSDIATEMNISEVHLSRKIRHIAGRTANDYIKEIRLQRARQLLEHKAMSSVSEIAYAVGFATPKYFTKIFIEQYGKKPSSYFRNE